MSIKDIVIGAVVTVTIGGTAYTVNQTDIINNFAEDTGLTQQQAEQYVNEVDEDDLVSYDELGSDYIAEGRELLDIADQIDCINYEYEWESYNLSCIKGKAQLSKTAEDEVSLGRAYKKLGTDSASETDMASTIRHIDEFNSDMEFIVIGKILDQATIDDYKNSNSYNKAVLKAVLESE